MPSFMQQHRKRTVYTSYSTTYEAMDTQQTEQSDKQCCISCIMYIKSLACEKKAIWLKLTQGCEVSDVVIHIFDGE